MSPDEMLAKMREQRRHRRGRPRLRAADQGKGMFRFVHEVFELEHALGARRGAHVEAVREIAQRRDLAFETFRRFVHRHRQLREAAAIGRWQTRLAAQHEQAFEPLQRQIDEIRKTLSPTWAELVRDVEAALAPI